MLEAVLDCLGCVEAPDVLMRQPEELTPEQGHPVVVGESLGDIVGIGRNQEILQVLQHLTALCRILFNLLFFECIPSNLGFPVGVVTGGSRQVNAT